jgi:hypothetical protein
MMATILSLMALTLFGAAVYAGRDADERVIRDIGRSGDSTLLNKREAKAFEGNGDENAEYVSFGGAFIIKRKGIQQFKGDFPIFRLARHRECRRMALTVVLMTRPQRLPISATLPDS